jgi:hypothetical protein
VYTFNVGPVAPQLAPRAGVLNGAGAKTDARLCARRYEARPLRLGLGSPLRQMP